MTEKYVLPHCALQKGSLFSGKNFGEYYNAEQMHAALEAGHKTPEGWQLVPKEPTPEMVKAAIPVLLAANSEAWEERFVAAFTAAVASAPEYKP